MVQYHNLQIGISYNTKSPQLLIYPEIFSEGLFFHHQLFLTVSQKHSYINQQFISLLHGVTEGILAVL